MTADEIRGALQAILFVAGEPVSTEQLSDALGGPPKEAIEAELEALRLACEAEGSGLALELTGGGYRFATRPPYDPYLRKFFARQAEARLSMAGLETLAIVAYRQPITAPEINEIRGVNSSGVLRTLLDRRMVRIAGRKPVVGSPFLYRTTKEFLVHFGLNNIQDLPRLEEFSEMLGVNLPEDLVLPDEIAIEGEVGEEADGQIVAESESSQPQPVNARETDDADEVDDTIESDDPDLMEAAEPIEDSDRSDDSMADAETADRHSSTNPESEEDRKPVESTANDQD